MKIGTAAPTEEYLKRVKHYFVGTLKLTDYYSAAQYESEVISLLEELFKSNNTILLTGGSMMYIDAICKGIDDIPTVDSETRQMMMEKYEKEGLDRLCAELKLLDPEYYSTVDLKIPKGDTRSGNMLYDRKNIYFIQNWKQKQRPFDIIKIGLCRDREELYERINKRVDIMIKEGLVDEVKSVYEYRNLNSLNTVGYKEIIQYLEGNCTLEFAIEK